MACLKEETVDEWILDKDLTWLEYSLVGLNVGQQV